MDIKTLTSIFLEQLEGTQDGETITLPHGTRLTVFVATPGGVLPVSKVESMTVHEAYAAFGSDDGRVFAQKDTVVAVRVDAEAKKERDVKLGFG